RARSAMRRGIAKLDPTRVRMGHAPFRVRMPRLRQPLRAPDSSRPAGRLPGVSGRGVAEAALGLRGAVEHSGQVVLACAAGPVRQLRRPARPRILLDELNAPAASRSAGLQACQRPPSSPKRLRYVLPTPPAPMV